MRIRIMVLAMGAFATAPAGAATFGIDFSVLGSSGFAGGFEAPPTGGPISSFTALIDGVVFDVQDGGFGFAYVPATNEFDMTASFTNSNATALCPVGACDLTLFPDPDPAILGDYQAVGPGPNFANFDDGTKYAILPPAVIPLPATLPLALAGLGALALVRRRRP